MVAKIAMSEDIIHRGLVGVCFDETTITDIPGRNGHLRYRGYRVDQIAQFADFETACYLLIYGEWPSQNQHRSFRDDLAARRALSVSTIDLLRSLRLATPDISLRTAVSCLAVECHDVHDALENGIDLIAKIPSLIAVHNDLRSARPVSEPNPQLSHSIDFLRRTLRRPPTVMEGQAIDMDFVMHADHGANASAFAARVIASTEADMFGAVTGAIAALSGSLHGGAVAAAAAMLEELERPDRAAELVATRRKQGLPIFGFGHRVYRRRDPRIDLYQKVAQAYCEAVGDYSAMAMVDALIAAMAPYKRMGIDANYDLYAAVIYRLLGFTNDLATPVFVAGRIAGWVAQVMEQQRNNILIRPRLRYQGLEPRELPARYRVESQHDETACRIYGDAG